MIKGMHTMFYTSDAVGLREFFRDKLGFAARDVGDGWLIFSIPEADMGCHPAEPANKAPSGMAHISFYCEDIHATVEELKVKGVEFDSDISDQGWGYATSFKAPGDFSIQLYQPKY